MKETETKPSRWRAFNTSVPIIGLAYFVIFEVVQIAVFVATTGSLAPFQYFFLPFVIVSALAAVGIWRESRAGYVAAMAVSLLLVVLLEFPGADGIWGVFSNPANTGEFFATVTNFPALLAVLIYSILGFRELRQRRAGKNIVVALPHAFPISGCVAFLLLGFIVGGLFVGLLAGATQARLLSSSGAGGDITIVVGASSSTNSQFYVPATFTTKVGSTVTWVNHDAAAHTVTSTSRAFDSGNMDSGGVFKFTFTQAGTYEYYCGYHSWMKGTVVVESG